MTRSTASITGLPIVFTYLILGEEALGTALVFRDDAMSTALSPGGTWGVVEGKNAPGCPATAAVDVPFPWRPEKSMYNVFTWTVLPVGWASESL